MILQLNPTIPIITPKGKAFAFFLLDYSIEHHLMWVCFLDDTGECWTFSNPEIRIQNNPTVGRVVSIVELPLKNTPEQSQPLQEQLVPQPLPLAKALKRTRTN